MGSKRIPVFIFKKNPQQIGNGIYSMVACFPILEVHVPFTFEAHSENEYLQTVGKPTKCNGTCKHYHGRIDDFSEERHETDYSVESIVEKARAFAKRNNKQ